MPYTVADFWKPKLDSVQRMKRDLVQGWEFVSSTLDGFVEAPLTRNKDLKSVGQSGSASIVLVSAPGAVGKTTLARHIAHATGALYVDLAKADPVGANTLAGGLVKSDLYSEWENYRTTAVIDGLDEARFRITWESFAAFLEDVANLSQGRRLPTILFGRTGSIQDTCLILSDLGVNYDVLEIGYFDLQKSVEFVESRLASKRLHRGYASVERDAAEIILQQLRNRTEHDGDRFAGYAPVLEAVANHIDSHNNVSALISQLKKGIQPITLPDVVRDILDRESKKLQTLQFEDENLFNRLYQPKEQLDHLVSLLYRTHKAVLPDMGSADARTYQQALTTWVPDHPFINGDQASTAVFDAVISGHALQHPASSKDALQKELERGSAANPFLSEFYPVCDTDEKPFLPSEHIGIVYASCRARLSIGDNASLIIEDKDDDSENIYSSVEISVFRGDAETSMVFSYESDQSGVVHLGSHVEDVEVTAESVDVCVGGGSEVVFVAPVDIACARIRIDARKVIVEKNLGSSSAAVILMAQQCDSMGSLSIPVVRHDADLLVSWPDADSYPWTKFATNFMSDDVDPRTDEALRRFRKFIVAFRSHKKGALARFRGKIEHSRMIKGTGQGILNQMIEEKIIYLKGSMYFLDPDRLMWQTGTNFVSASAYRFDHAAREFIDRALRGF